MPTICNAPGSVRVVEDLFGDSIQANQVTLQRVRAVSAKNSRERSRIEVLALVLALVFALTRMRMFARIVRANSSRRSLSNAIRANNLRMKLIFD